MMVFPAKRIFVFVFLILVIETLMSCSRKAYIFTSFREPATEGLRLLYSDDAKNWKNLNRIFLKPEIGSQLVMRDPSIAQGKDGTFHLVWTSAWRGDRGFGYSSSKDLINWTSQKFIPVLQTETTTVNVWAPELFYDKERDQFIIVWASTIPNRFARGIEDEDNNHRLYSITTKDFKSFSESKLFLDPGFSVIDGVIVKREKDDYVLVLKDNTRPNRNLKVAFAKNALGPFGTVSSSFTKKLTEGPSVVRVGKEWLIYFDSYGDKTYQAVKTKDFLNFTEIQNEISIPEGHKHGTIIQVKRKIVDQLKNLQDAK